MTGGLEWGGLLEKRALGCVAPKEAALEKPRNLGGPSGGGGGRKAKGGLRTTSGAGTGLVDLGFLGGCLVPALFLP